MHYCVVLLCEVYCVVVSELGNIVVCFVWYILHQPCMLPVSLLRGRPFSLTVHPVQERKHFGSVDLTQIQPINK